MYGEVAFKLVNAGKISLTSSVYSHVFGDSLYNLNMLSREYSQGSDSRPGSPGFVPYSVLQTNQLMVLSQKEIQGYPQRMRLQRRL